MSSITAFRSEPLSTPETGQSWQTLNIGLPGCASRRARERTGNFQQMDSLSRARPRKASEMHYVAVTIATGTFRLQGVVNRKHNGVHGKGNVS